MWFVLTSNILFSSLSQNCIGDEGMKKLAATLRDLPKLHCLRWGNVPAVAPGKVVKVQ